MMVTDARKATEKRSHEKKKSQLGMAIGTASGRLRKELMFSFAQRLGLDICFQCGTKIHTAAELSVEHKIPWMDSVDPVTLFFDLDNVAFSHLSCNIGAAKKPNKLPFTDEERRVLKNKKARVQWAAQPKSKRQSIRKSNYERNGC